MFAQLTISHETYTALASMGLDMRDSVHVSQVLESHFNYGAT